MKRKKKVKPSKLPKSEPKAVGRLQSFDSYRGAAIAIMILDHIAGIIFHQPIDGNPIRLFTRLSMPMFAVLTGYLLGKTDGVSPRRIGAIFVAAVLVNLVTYSEIGKIEILGSFLVCYLLHAILKRYSWLMIGGILLALLRKDYTAIWFDYPISIVATCVGVGLMYRRFGMWGGAAGSAFALCGIDWIPGHYAYSLYAVPIAFILLTAAERIPNRRELQSGTMPWRQWSFSAIPILFDFGRYPLILYVVQYYIIIAIHRFVIY